MSIATSNSGQRPPSIEEVKARYTIFDAWRDEGCPGEPGRSCKSPFRQDRHASFSVYEDGRKFKDHADDCGGDVVDFIAKARGCTLAEALAVARERIGWRPGAHGPALSRRREAPRMTPRADTEPTYRAEPMSGEVRAAWEAGLRWLKIDAGMQVEIDRWRGWPSGTTHFLAEEGLLAAPESKGARGLAFVVQYPGRSAWIETGYHMRHKPRRAGDRVVWTYQPAGVGMPCVPFVLGNFYGARLVIVCEGEWDCVTFAAAAGWLAHDTAWPDGVAVLGVRGASGWRTFLEHWRPRWPRRPRFLLVPDNDEAGLKWHTEFAGALTPLALSVTVLTPKAGGPKDFNDLHRQKPFTPESVYGLLRSLGLMDVKGFPV
ncbi:MAG: hypothetical protein JNJ82_05330 [Opitutaceae bacterium]|nr:hypothetical protein [Opitutaceae bacterium]